MRGDYSLADIAAATGNNNEGAFGDNGSWWIIIFLIFAFTGFGRNGFGGNGGVADNYALATDFATLERKLDGVNNGLCEGFYAQNTNMLNGFAGVQNALCQGFAGINNSIVNNGYETRNALNTLGYNLQDCCCQTQRAIDNVNYNMATNTCAINNNITMNTRDVLEQINANYRALHDEIVANKLEMKNDRIVEQQNEINALRLKASQEAQNSYLINQLKPCPSPSYIVPNPNCCYNTCNSGCNQFI